jgi:anti-sigma regulatory factor (Ser/Thr protein kinase)
MDSKAIAVGQSVHVGLTADEVPGSLRGNTRAWVPISHFAAQQRYDMADQWPLRSSLEFGPLPSAVPCARLHVRQLLWEWNLTDFSEDAELVASELLTNAVRVSRALELFTSVRLWLVSDRRRVLILVWDSSLQPPVRINTSDDAETGRGLLLVETISTRWNWYFPHDLGGKMVWAQIGAESQ